MSLDEMILWLICPIGPLSQIGWNVCTDLGSGHLRNRLCYASASPVIGVASTVLRHPNLVPKVADSGSILWLICPIGPLSQISWNVRTDLGSQSCQQWFDPLADLSNWPTVSDQLECSH